MATRRKRCCAWRKRSTLAIEPNSAYGLKRTRLSKKAGFAEALHQADWFYAKTPMGVSTTTKNSGNTRTTSRCKAICASTQTRRRSVDWTTPAGLNVAYLADDMLVRSHHRYAIVAP